MNAAHMATSHIAQNNHHPKPDHQCVCAPRDCLQHNLCFPSGSAHACSADYLWGGTTSSVPHGRHTKQHAYTLCHASIGLPLVVPQLHHGAFAATAQACPQAARPQVCVHDSSSTGFQSGRIRLRPLAQVTNKCTYVRLRDLMTGHTLCWLILCCHVGRFEALTG
jgi:hypothetical protein